MKLLRPTLATLATVAAVVGAFASACNHAAGPSLSYRIENHLLVPTSDSTDVTNVNAVCCCRVTGRITNTSTIPVHLSIRYKAVTNAGADPGTAQDFLENVAAGETREFDAPGILEACANVRQITPDVVVIGLFEP
jgi:hypothetical protein